MTCVAHSVSPSDCWSIVDCLAEVGFTGAALALLAGKGAVQAMPTSAPRAHTANETNTGLDVSVELSISSRPPNLYLSSEPAATYKR